MGKYIGDQSAILVKVEAVPGVYEEPTVVVPLERGGEMWVPESDKETFDPTSAHHGSKETVVITDFAQQPVSAKMKLPAAHGLIAPLLAACGVVATPITGGVAYAYSTNSATTASMMQMGKRVITRASGERGDMTLTAEVGKPVEIGFEFKGMFKEQVRLAAADADNVIPATPSMEMVFLPKSCTAHLLNGNQAHFTKVELKLGADIGTPKDTCPGESWTKDVQPEMMISMMDAIDNTQSFNDLKNGTAFNLVIELHDIHGNKKYELIVPKMVVIEHKTPKDQGLITLDRTFECRKVTGDDNWELRAFD